MLKIRYQAQFKKDYKRVVSRGYDADKLEEVISLLVQQKPLPQKYRDHPLRGNYVGTRECHIEPDWLLIYEVVEDELLLLLMRTGSHSDLFRK